LKKTRRTDQLRA